MFQHITVLKREAVDGLNILEERAENGVFVDCTLGGAGHSSLIASRLGKQGKLICIDQDEKAITNAKKALQKYEDQVILVKNNFRNIDQILDQLNLDKVDGFLYDLGVSSPQLDEAERGFSYQNNASLDMRMDQDQSLTAYTIVNEWSEKKLADLIFHYGEEKFSRRIAKNIVQQREKERIETTHQLAEIIKESIPAATRRSGGHPAKRTFQAIRIAVNDELQAFEDSLEQALKRLHTGGRISVITFHSLEDRICKQFFKKKSQGCTCPSDFPICVCGKEAQLKVKTNKAILPSEEELGLNNRARSAKLRIAEKT